MTARRLHRETHSPGETEALGREIAERLRPGEAVLLLGDLGAGKSVLARGIIRGLPGGEGRTVRSPTFVYVQHHPTTPPVHHVDLYRLPAGFDLADLGMADWANGADVTIIEWAQKLNPADFPRRTVIRIEAGEGTRRKITVETD